MLPTALERLEGRPQARGKAGKGADAEVKEDGQVLHPAPPAFIWWLSLAWLERGIFEAGAVVVRLGIGAGRLAERLEGRYYLPLALLLALLTLLAIAR